MKRRDFAIASLLIAMTVAAQSTPPTSDPSPGTPAERASPPSAANKETVFFIPSSGFIADHTFIVYSLTQGGSAMSKQLANLLSQAAQHPYQITVAGQNEAKTLNVVKSAFDILGDLELHDLDFTFVGSPKAAAHVKKLVKAVGGTYHTRLTLDD
jgi:hypothetical protein